MSAAAAPSITDAFQALLAHAETLGLSEGNYLAVANSLKSAFKTAEPAGAATLYPQTTSILLKRDSHRLRIRCTGVSRQNKKPYILYHLIAETLNEAGEVINAPTSKDTSCDGLFSYSRTALSAFNPLECVITSQGVSAERTMLECLKACKLKDSAYLKMTSTVEDGETDDELDNAGYEYDYDRFIVAIARQFTDACQAEHMLAIDEHPRS